MNEFWDRIAAPRSCFVIAEIGVNHNGSVEIAKALIDVAVQAGADAVKFQTFFAEELVTRTARQADYQIANIGKSTSQYQMLKDLELDRAAYLELKQYCDKAGIIFLSTPFSERAADLLDDIGVNGFKVSSGDLTHLPLLRNLGRRGKPVILSTGMANLSETEAAIDAVRSTGNQRIAVLHCVSDYPADPATCNLNVMSTLRAAFGTPVGWSDHTTGDAISVAAVAMGAQLLEKHFTLDCEMAGPDHRASLEPKAFIELVEKVRSVESALGDGFKAPTLAERATAQVARRSLVLARALPAGHKLQAGDVVVLRPGTGIAPEFLDQMAGFTLGENREAGHVLQWADVRQAAPLAATNADHPKNEART